MVLPRPTPSAMRMRGRSWPRALAAGSRLVGGLADGALVAEGEGGIGRGGAAEQGLEVQAGLAVAGGVVADELRLLGAEGDDLVEVGEERGLVVADELGEADGGDGLAVGGVLDAADHPLFVADDDAGSGGDGGQGLLQLDGEVFAVEGAGDVVEELGVVFEADDGVEVVVVVGGLDEVLAGGLDEPLGGWAAGPARRRVG